MTPLPKTSSFETFSLSNKESIDRQLRVVLAPASLTGLSKANKDLMKQLALLVGRGGKRLRPLLCVLAYEAYGGRKRRAIIKPAASQELLHTFLLIHDDIIDRDFQRWGGSNILGVYFDRASQSMAPRNALHHAEAYALLAGDMCFALANETLMTANFAPDVLLPVQRLQQQVIMQVLRGELSDTVYAADKRRPSEQQILTMYADKTASYSFGLPLQTGAMLAGANQRQLDLLTQFAVAMGIAYQLQDDVLGMFGSERTTGKPVTSDLREGKLTVLALKTFELATPAQRRRFQTLFGNDEIDAENLAAARDIITTSGAKRYVQDLAQSYAQQARDCIEQTAMNEVGKVRLTDLIRLLTNRSK